MRVTKKVTVIKWSSGGSNARLFARKADAIHLIESSKHKSTMQSKHSTTELHALFHVNIDVMGLNPHYTICPMSWGHGP